MSGLFQWAIVAFIILSILYHVFKGGTANPESTGSIDKRVNVLGERVSTLSTRVGQVETEMKERLKGVASTKDVEQLEQLIDERLNTIRADVEAHREISKTTGRNVQRIYDIMLDKGLGAK